MQIRKNSPEKSFWYLKTKQNVIYRFQFILFCFVFLLQSTFFFRNVNVEIYVQEKVGKRQDVIVGTWISIAQTFATVARKLMTICLSGILEICMILANTIVCIGISTLFAKLLLSLQRDKSPLFNQSHSYIFPKLPPPKNQIFH